MRSLPQMPQARMRTRISPGPGAGTGSCSTATCPDPRSTAARMVPPAAGAGLAAVTHPATPSGIRAHLTPRPCSRSSKTCCSSARAARR